MPNYPLVSVIIPTKNSARIIADCLQSVLQQTYPHIEIIVVDNHSVDDTAQIASTYASQVLIAGPERTAQRNIGAAAATGQYVLFIDSDMVLDDRVVQQSVMAMNSQTKAMIIPEISVGQGFWAHCKRLEKSFYQGIDWMEAARFFDRKSFEEVGKWDEQLVSGEDWELTQRLRARYKINRITAPIYHHEGRIDLIQDIRKKFYYARHFANYTSTSSYQNQPSNPQTNPLARYALYFQHPRTLFRQPTVGIGLLFMKTAEFAAGMFGYGLGKLNNSNFS